ncbi:glycerol-3-phosphate 1-O-acyltransferase PlsY [Salibaculum griseiflavum]|uniref:Glycerol-3-phosphate acyltransferase n=1 Tax=Salibaculum griseiflavum TaxID=1914409 RepID=A0A2V1P414_9RHOB|nr:glycerol-3-phosphate 1-O-acyltransferase PlsY [Salibaculum griseiflavum]PWG16510.1 acyl-phosphate glycerol 3-phosphate acyltransferase [Salibaculum griseiflavum]
MPELMSGLPTLGLWAIIGYLIGSVSAGLLMARIFGLGDLRQIGSGNIGATNVLRTGNKLAALLTLVLDAGKGAIAVLLARVFVAEDAVQLAGLAAFIGHCFPVWLGFRGGKGVATFLGTLLALAWPLGLAACATWLVTAALFRISSLSALVAAVLAPLWAQVLGLPGLTGLCLVLAVVILIRHADNIRRLLNGTEKRIGQKS